MCPTINDITQIIFKTTMIPLLLVMGCEFHGIPDDEAHGYLVKTAEDEKEELMEWLFNGIVFEEDITMTNKPAIEGEYCPTPILGDKALREYVDNQVRAPSTCGEGKVYVHFTVGLNGRVKNPRILSSYCKEADEEALRVIRLVRFHPETEFEKPVSSNMFYPINFR